MSTFALFIALVIIQLWVSAKAQKVTRSLSEQVSTYAEVMTTDFELIMTPLSEQVSRSTSSPTYPVMMTTGPTFPSNHTSGSTSSPTYPVTMTTGPTFPSTHTSGFTSSPTYPVTMTTGPTFPSTHTSGFTSSPTHTTMMTTELSTNMLTLTPTFTSTPPSTTPLTMALLPTPSPLTVKPIGSANTGGYFGGGFITGGIIALVPCVVAIVLLVVYLRKVKRHNPQSKDDDDNDYVIMTASHHQEAESPDKSATAEAAEGVVGGSDSECDGNDDGLYVMMEGQADGVQFAEESEDELSEREGNMGTAVMATTIKGEKS